jgi:hypothetical protein
MVVAAPPVGDAPVKIKYFKDTDTLYIELRRDASSRRRISTRARRSISIARGTSTPLRSSMRKSGARSEPSLTLLFNRSWVKEI